MKKILLSLLVAIFAHAAESEEDLTPREAALERLLSERGSGETFAATIVDARKHGIGEQAILEARFVFHVDRQEDEAIAALLPDFLERNTTFKVEDSEIFATKEDWLAVVEYVKSIVALRAGDKAAFKTHITEAFWLSPRQGTAFAPHIDRLRLAETMATVKVDFQGTFPSLTETDPVTLARILGDKKALLLQFWSPLSPECEASLPDFAAIAGELEKSRIAVATVILESSAKNLAESRTMLKALGEEPPGTWLVDRDRDSLGVMLRVQNLPSMVLVSTAGTVLFNGPPSSDDLWTALKKIEPSIARPPSR